MPTSSPLLSIPSLLPPHSPFSSPHSFPIPHSLPPIPSPLPLSPAGARRGRPGVGAGGERHLRAAVRAAPRTPPLRGLPGRPPRAVHSGEYEPSCCLALVVWVSFVAGRDVLFVFWYLCFFFFLDYYHFLSLSSLLVCLRIYMFCASHFDVYLFRYFIIFSIRCISFYYHYVRDCVCVCPIFAMLCQSSSFLFLPSAG